MNFNSHYYYYYSEREVAQQKAEAKAAGVFHELQ